MADTDKEIASLRAYFKTQTQSYLKHWFVPLCCGFFTNYGVVGKERAKRFICLLTGKKNGSEDYFNPQFTGASEHGMIFLIHMMLYHTTSHNLSKLLNADSAMIQSFKKLNAGKQYPAELIEVFSDFLNVTYPSAKFKHRFNSIISRLTPQEIANPNSQLLKDVRQLKKDLAAELRREQVRILHAMPR